VIVASNRIGSINHALLTEREARGAGARIIGIVFNHPEGRRSGFAQKTNPGLFNEFSKLPVLGIVPHVPGIRSGKKNPLVLGKFLKEGIGRMADKRKTL
ncbi:MAG TPA: AAA family ATPase, partial [Nitrospiria bacterium]